MTKEPKAYYLTDAQTEILYNLIDYQFDRKNSPYDNDVLEELAAAIGWEIEPNNNPANDSLDDMYQDLENSQSIFHSNNPNSIF